MKALFYKAFDSGFQDFFAAGFKIGFRDFR
jgi:hypothetical protein